MANRFPNARTYKSSLQMLMMMREQAVRVEAALRLALKRAVGFRMAIDQAMATHGVLDPKGPGMKVFGLFGGETPPPPKAAKKIDRKAVEPEVHRLLATGEWLTKREMLLVIGRGFAIDETQHPREWDKLGRNINRILWQLVKKGDAEERKVAGREKTWRGCTAGA